MNGPARGRERRRFIGLGSGTAWALVVAASVVNGVVYEAAGMPPVAFIAVAGALYLVGGIVGPWWLERHGTVRHRAIYIAVLFAVGMAVTIATHGASGLVLAAGVSQAVLYLPLWGVVAATVAAVGGYGALVVTTLPMATALAVMGAYTAAVAFVIGFSRLAVRAHDARAEAEHLAGELHEANERLRSYAARVEELATVEERNRIAREIHDGVGHCLTAVHVHLSVARELAHRDAERADDAVAKAQAATAAALGDLRRSVALVRDPSPRPFTEALRELAETSCGAGLEARLTIAGRPRPLAPSIESALFRVAQEGITNARRHAGAANVEIGVEYRDAAVALRIADDGRGAPAESNEAAGFGLVGVRERVEAVGGTVAIRARPGSGFELAVEVPCPEA
jgi:signal transduction histidine kinase